jgi:hypothetical protein
MNTQAKESKKIVIPAIAVLLLSVKNTVIHYQAKLFPFAKAFLGLCLSGLLLVSCASEGSGQKRAGNIWNANIDSGRLDHFGVSTIKCEDLKEKSGETHQVHGECCEDKIKL